MPCSRVWSILLTNFAIVIFRVSAIFFSSIQKGSSRLKLVLCPPTVMERFTIEDFITPQCPRNAVIFEGATVASFSQFTKARAATTRGGESVGVRRDGRRKLDRSGPLIYCTWGRAA